MKNIRKNIKIFLLQFLLKKMTKMENRLILLYFLSTKTDPKTSLALIKIKIHGFSFHVKQVKMRLPYVEEPILIQGGCPIKSIISHVYYS